MDSPQRTARLAGLAYLLLGITSVFGLLCAPLVRVEAAALARMIAASDLRFRLAIASDLISEVCGVFLVVFLYQLLKPVHRIQAVLMAILLLVAVPISFAITLLDLGAHILLSGDQLLSTFSRPQLDALASVLLRMHIQGVYAIEIYWGLWLLPFGLLVFKSGFLPRVLGVLLLVSGGAYVAHCFVALLLPAPLPAMYETATMVARGVGELPIILWLLIRGVAQSVATK